MAIDQNKLNQSVCYAWGALSEAKIVEEKDVPSQCKVTEDSKAKFNESQSEFYFGKYHFHVSTHTKENNWQKWVGERKIIAKVNSNKPAQILPEQDAASRSADLVKIISERGSEKSPAF